MNEGVRACTFQPLLIDDDVVPFRRYKRHPYFTFCPAIFLYMLSGRYHLIQVDPST
jgi:hypothetical protein